MLLSSCALRANRARTAESRSDRAAAADPAARAHRDGADYVLVHGIISDPVDDEFIELRRRNGAYYVPTHVAYEACADLAAWVARIQAFDDRRAVPGETYAALRSPEAVGRFEGFWTKTAYAKERLPVLRSNLKRLSDAGIPIVMGTDTGLPGVLLGIASQIELRLYVEAGRSPVQALSAATTTAGQMLGRESELGAIEPGYQADLVVLDADPESEWRALRRAHLL